MPKFSYNSIFLKLSHFALWNESYWTLKYKRNWPPTHTHTQTHNNFRPFQMSLNWNSHYLKIALGKRFFWSYYTFFAAIYKTAYKVLNTIQFKFNLFHSNHFMVHEVLYIICQNIYNIHGTRELWHRLWILDIKMHNLVKNIIVSSCH